MTTITQTITALPTAPNPNTQTPSVFNTNAIAHVAALSTMVTEQNTMASQMNTVSGEVNTNAGIATTKASESSASADASAASAALAAAIANMVGEWSDQTGSASTPLSVSHEGAFWILLEDLADITAEEPGSSASWSRAFGVGQIFERASNVELTAEDNGKIIDYTSGTITQTLDAAANLGPNWCAYPMNTGSGAVTLDPDGSELIDGATTKVLRKDTVTLVICSGTAFSTIEFAKPVSDHAVIVTTGNGYGSTNTKIRRFTTTQEETGTAITYADSAGNGASFTINEPGLYAVKFSDAGTGSNVVYGIGISVNSAELTTDIDSITAANRLDFAAILNSASGSNSCGNIGGVFRFEAGDVVRAHNGLSNLANQTAAAFTKFEIRKVGV